MRGLALGFALILFTGCAGLADRASGALEGWRKAAQTAGIEVDDLKAVIRVAVAVAKLIPRDVDDPNTAPPVPVLIATIDDVNFPVICATALADRCAEIVAPSATLIRRGRLVPCPESHREVEGQVYSTCLEVHNFIER